MILITDQFDYLTFNLLIVLPRYRFLAFLGVFLLCFFTISKDLLVLVSSDLSAYTVPSSMISEMSFIRTSMGERAEN